MQPDSSLVPQRTRLAGLTAVLRSLLSPLVSRAAFGGRFGFGDGVTHNGRRDLYEVCGYDRAIPPVRYLEKYRRGGIAKTIVDLYPQMIWAGGADVTEDPDPAVTTDFEQDVDTLVREKDLWSLMMRAHKAARLGQYSAVLIGAPGDPGTELPLMRGPQDIAFFKIYGELRAKVKSVVTDATDPRYGQPLLYDIYTGTPTSYSQALDVSAQAAMLSYGPAIAVHWSRIHHVAEGLLEDDVYGEPSLRPVWNLLAALEKIIHGGAETQWQRAAAGLHLNYKGTGNPEVDSEFLKSEEFEAIETQTEEFIHQLSPMLLTAFMETGQVGGAARGQIAQFGPNAEALVRQISASTGYPNRVLLGSERGDLASSQDDDNLAARASEKRREFAVPNFRAFMGRLIHYGALRAPRAEGYEVSWPERNALNEAEKVAVLAQLATANNQQVQAGQPAWVTTDEGRDMYLDLGPLAEAVSPGADSTELSKYRSARRRFVANARLESQVLRTLRGRKYMRQLQAADPATKREFYLVEAPRIPIHRALTIEKLRELSAETNLSLQAAHAALQKKTTRPVAWFGGRNRA